MTLLLVVISMMILGGDGLKWYYLLRCFCGVLWVPTLQSTSVQLCFMAWLKPSRLIVQVKPEFEEENEIP